jgi:hypothetical protein
MRPFQALIRLIRRPLIALALLLAGTMPPGAQTAGGWTTYQNERFGYRLIYPADVFQDDGAAPENADGRTFLSRDGRAKIVVYGANNDERFSPSEYRSTILKEFPGYDQMDYAPKGQSWFVLSGFRGAAIYYQKVMFSCDNRIINVFSVTFPREEKRFYENLIERMEDGFKPRRC